MQVGTVLNTDCRGSNPIEVQTKKKQKVSPAQHYEDLINHRAYVGPHKIALHAYEKACWKRHTQQQ